MNSRKHGGPQLLRCSWSTDSWSTFGGPRWNKVRNHGASRSHYTADFCGFLQCSQYVLVAYRTHIGLCGPQKTLPFGLRANPWPLRGPPKIRSQFRLRTHAVWDTVHCFLGAVRQAIRVRLETSPSRLPGRHETAERELRHRPICGRLFGCRRYLEGLAQQLDCFHLSGL